MEKQTKIDEFKREFKEEISARKVEVEQLKKNKVPSSVLEAETFLRKVFGDEIFVPKKTEEKLTGEKDVQKLSEEEVAFDTEIRGICENLPNAEFDNNIGVLLSKSGIEGI